MATTGTGNLNLVDHAKRQDPNGEIATIAEMLMEKSEILQDMVVKEGNLDTGNRVTMRAGLPDIAFRKLNKGVPADKSETQQVDEDVGLAEAFMEVDIEIADQGGMREAFLASEATAFVQAMEIKMSDTLFYGDSTLDPEEFLGLAPRYSDLAAENADNILDAGGTGSDNTSIWLIGWSDETVYTHFPRGMTAGLQFKDLGEQTKDTTVELLQVLRSNWKWRMGVSLKDWRYAVRIPNIDVSDLTKDAAAGADLINLMQRALETIWSLDGVRPAFYVNRTIRSFLRQQTTNKSNVNLFLDDQGNGVSGKKVLMFDEVPVRRSDSLLNTEARVV